MKSKRKREGGYTIVELIVAMSVFTILLTVAVGIFTRTIRIQRSLVYRMAVNNNAGLVLEQISRDIRTGHFFCGEGADPCDEDGPSVNFIDHKGRSVTYFLDGSGAISKTTEGVGTVALTASDIVVKYFNFRVTQIDSDICNPWRITVRMRIGSDETDPAQDVLLQTTVSSRVLPVEATGVSQEVINRCS